MAKAKYHKPYYYAGGKRVTLERAGDVVALNGPLLAEKFPDLSAEGAMKQSTRLSGSEIRLVPRSELTDDTLSRLTSAGITQTVYRQDGATLVSLPEIRVENDADPKLADVRRFAAKMHIHVTDLGEGRLTLNLDPAESGEAVKLAAQLFEEFDVSATPRFLRLMPRPTLS